MSAELSTCGETESDAILLGRYQEGEPEAASAIHGRYEQRVLGLVRKRWPNRMHSRLDPDDVAQEVFQRFFCAAKRGCYRLATDGSLWGILLVTTLNRIRKAASYHCAARRDVRLKLSLAWAEQQYRSFLEQRATTEVADVCVADVLEALPAVPRKIVHRRLEGYTALEIAEKLEISLRTVERHLQWARCRVPGLLGLEAPNAEAAWRPRSA